MKITRRLFIQLISATTALVISPFRALAHKESTVIENAYGLCITLNAPGGLFIDKWRESLKQNPPTKKSVDVIIKCDDHVVEMTFEEFLLRVGL